MTPERNEPPTGPGPASRAPPDGRLLDRLREGADADGWVRFDRFLEVAQYDAEVGYYARRGRTLGPEGDFYTAAHVGPLLGRLLAHRAAELWNALDRPPDFRVVELGPGDGAMAVAFLEAVRRRGTEGIGPGVYTMVERRSEWAAAALEAAEPVRPEGWQLRVRASVGADGPFRGMVIANELLDALPCRRFRRVPDGWIELGVAVEADAIVERGRSVAPSGVPDRLPETAVNGATLEIAPGLAALFREVGDALVEGSSAWFDYGGPETYWSERAGPGTFRAYRAHRELPEPLAGAGIADLSCWVNFDRVRTAARAAGLVEGDFGPQASVLAEWGLGPIVEAWVREAPTPAERVRRSLSAKQLLFGFDSFYALELRAARTAARGSVSPSDGPARPGPPPRPAPPRLRR